jgi:hypothetical protein
MPGGLRCTTEVAVENENSEALVAAVRAAVEEVLGRQPAPEIRLEPHIEVNLPEQAPPVVNVNVEPARPRSVRVTEDPETGERIYVSEEAEQ